MLSKKKKNCPAGQFILSCRTGFTLQEKIVVVERRRFPWPQPRRREGRQGTPCEQGGARRSRGEVASRPGRTRRCDYVTPTEVASTFFARFTPSHVAAFLLVASSCLPIRVPACLPACLRACLPASPRAHLSSFLPACMHAVRALTMSRT